MRYVLRHMKGHPFSSGDGLISEHRLVAETALGRYIHPRHPIHHVDNDGRNNAPSNLVICESLAYHQLLHRRERALIACENPAWRPCVFCGKHDDLSNLVRRCDPNQFQHLSCAKDYALRLHHRRMGTDSAYREKRLEQARRYRATYRDQINARMRARRARERNL